MAVVFHQKTCLNDYVHRRILGWCARFFKKFAGFLFAKVPYFFSTEETIRVVVVVVVVVVEFKVRSVRLYLHHGQIKRS